MRKPLFFLVFLAACRGKDFVDTEAPTTDDSGYVEDSDCETSTFYTDADGDGYGADPVVEACEARPGLSAQGGDCDDAQPSVFPGAAEDEANGVDEDCDGGDVCWADEDGDGYAGEGTVVSDDLDCEDPGEGPQRGQDCDDTDPELNPDTLWYADADNDTYGSSTNQLQQCEDPSDTTTWIRTDNSDCDDGNPNAYPGGTEVCDGADNDCDGTVDNGEQVVGEAGCPADSCLHILDTRATAPTGGGYSIDPDGDGAETEVYCDMTTDGGGYTFYKLNAGFDTYAIDAEEACAALGMQLFVPRTEAHKDAAIDVALDASIGGDGDILYLYILGIYPDVSGAGVGQGSQCVNTAFNSGGCTSWAPDDGGPFWVGDATNISEPNGDCGTDSSMFYTWNTTTSEVNWYNDIPSPGYASTKFVCDVGDKWGA